MDSNRHIKKEVEQALSSIDNLAQAKAPDFFYTRLEARMEQQLVADQTPLWWIANLRVSMAVLSVFMILNVSTLFLMSQSDSSTEMTETNIDSLKQEYFSGSDDYQYLNDY